MIKARDGRPEADLEHAFPALPCVHAHSVMSNSLHPLGDSLPGSSVQGIL